MCNHAHFHSSDPFLAFCEELTDTKQANYICVAEGLKYGQYQCDDVMQFSILSWTNLAGV